MIDDMTIRNMSSNIYAVANFSAFHSCSPDKLGLEEERRALSGRGGVCMMSREFSQIPLE